MQEATKLGMNRTGVQMSPLATPEMLQGTEQFQPAVEGRDQAAGLMQLRVEYRNEADALGSVPPPGTVRGALATGMQKLAGRNPELLIDKLAERLAFERSGVRLYEAFLVKLRANTGAAPRVPLAEAEEIRDAELRHFGMLTEVLESIGADPTCQTPCADATGVMSSGFVQVMTDPRTTLPQALEALLAVELIDNASWELLIELADDAGLADATQRFRAALNEEATHVARVREWLRRELLQ